MIVNPIPSGQWNWLVAKLEEICEELKELQVKFRKIDEREKMINFGEIEMPNIGEIRWSGFFNSYVYLERFDDDSNWWFHLEGRYETMKAQTKWSTMPLVKPERVET